jgi:cwf18 pre-mRNA splicing factor
MAHQDDVKIVFRNYAPMDDELRERYEVKFDDGKVDWASKLCKHIELLDDDNATGSQLVDESLPIAPRKLTWDLEQESKADEQEFERRTRAALASMPKGK